MFTRKVVWSEGMFLRPQHFQQQERYLEFFSHARALATDRRFNRMRPSIAPRKRHQAG